MVKKLVYAAPDGTTKFGLWVTDRTAAAPPRCRGEQGAKNLSPYYLTVLGNKVLLVVLIPAAISASG